MTKYRKNFSFYPHLLCFILTVTKGADNTNMGHFREKSYGKADIRQDEK